MTFRANYASGFRAPTLKEMYMHFDMGNMGYMIIGNPDLEPEKSHNFNLAIERTNRIRNSGFLDGRYNFTLMGYCNIFDKRITTIAGPEYNGMESALYWNEDGVTVWGIDASLGHRCQSRTYLGLWIVTQAELLLDERDGQRLLLRFLSAPFTLHNVANRL